MGAMDAVNDHGALSAAITAMAIHGESVLVQESALGLLGLGVIDGCGHIEVVGDAVPAILCAMATHCKSAAIQHLSASALWAIVENARDDAVSQIVAGHGIEFT